MVSDIGFSSFSGDFGGARLVLTSKSASSRYFASDGRVLRPVRGLEAVAMRSDPRTAPRAGPSYARFLVFLEAWILIIWEFRWIEGLWSGLHALRPEASADFCLEHRKCLVWNTGNALLGAHECLACNKGNLVFAIEETYDDSS